MTEHLVDFQITKVYEAKNKEGVSIEGEGEYGAWKLYAFYTNKTDKDKFNFMWGEKKIVPKQGMGIKHMEYEKEKKGEYTNLNVKKLELAEDQPEPKTTPASTSKPTPTQSNGNKDASFYVSYAKDLQIALIQADPKRYEKRDLDDLAKLVVNIGVMMADMVSGKPPKKSSQDRNLGGTGDDQGEEDTLPQKKVWSSKKVFVEDIKSFEHEDMLGLDQYVDMLTLHDINPDELLSLNKEQGLALFLDLEKALKTKNKNSF